MARLLRALRVRRTSVCTLARHAETTEFQWTLSISNNLSVQVKNADISVERANASHTYAPYIGSRGGETVHFV